MTQSTVSARVAALEAKLGQRLFRRGRAGTALTEEGLRFEPHARVLRLAWVDAQRAVAMPAQANLAMRLGFQPDLVGERIGAWIAIIKSTLADTALYLEASFSAHMSAELLSGALDLGILFTPTPHPDLYYETLAEIRYQMVSSDAARVSKVDLDSYIVPDYSPAFLRSHAERLPDLAHALVTAGQSNLALSMQRRLGGTAYQPEATAAMLVAEGGFLAVEDAPILHQPVYGAVHIRNRHRAVHRRTMRAIAAGL